MAECSMYYVPRNQGAFAGRAREVAEAFWAIGEFVDADEVIHERLKDYRARGEALPASRHAFTYGLMGITDEVQPEQVPTVVYDLACPVCEGDVTEEVWAVWESEGEAAPIPDRLVACATCSALTPSRKLSSSTTPFTFARFFLWVGDVEDDFEPEFKQTVETILGPCDVFEGWET
jgi:hypothetical protein